MNHDDEYSIKIEIDCGENDTILLNHMCYSMYVLSGFKRTKEYIDVSVELRCYVHRTFIPQSSYTYLFLCIDTDNESSFLLI